MREVYFGEFRIMVVEHIREIEQVNPQSHSTEWFLLKYLKRIAQNANPPATRGIMENCMRGLIRFYVDNIEENSPLGERCRSMHAPFVHALRVARCEE